MRKFLMIVGIATTALTTAGGAFADIPIVDGANETKRDEDREHSEKDTKTQTDQVDEQTATNCNISKREKSRRLHRSPAQAVQRDAANVALIKHYAQKYNVPVGLALSVAHAESGISTCSGSPTGVKGVMQLTKKTGRWLGFDRDINEENIEGGIKYLGMGVKSCGSTDYACLASFYNGSTAAEQANWAGKVGRNHNWFNAYSGSTNIADIPSPAYKTRVDYGSGAIRSSSGAAFGAVDTARTGLDRSAAKMQASNNLLDSLSATVGTSSVYQDAWDENTQARSVNAELLNNLITVRSLFNELVQARMQSKLTSISEGSKTVKLDPNVNPYNCDPTILKKTNVPRSRWPACAVRAASENGKSQLIVESSDASIRNNLISVQKAAEAAE